jgi:hypothetical protein
MRREVRSGAVLALVLSTFVFSVGAAGAHPRQHGPTTDHLIGTGEWGKIDFVGKLVVPDATNDLIADVTVFGNYAYLARWGGPECAGPETGGQTTPEGGVYVIDISDPANPKLVNFIATHQDTLVGEGMQVIHMETAAFTGDVLLMNHEGCGKNYKGGVSLWDVTNPLKPKKLSEHFGDITIGGVKSPPDVNQTHSAFMWFDPATRRAYLVSVDDEEPTDVDIFDITNPKRPKLLIELDLNRFAIGQPELGLDEVFLHDMVVKQINGRWIMLLSYWDGGWVLLDVTNPSQPVFLGDSDYAAVDPELLQQTGASLTPEGNAHQAEFTIDNRFFIGTDEDFGPYRALVSITDANDPGDFRAAIGSPAPQLDPSQTLTGETVFVGRACNGDAAVPAGDGNDIALIERGLCTFSEKLANVEAAGGYVAAIIMNREGADACTGVFSPFVEADIPVIFVGRDTGFRILNLTYNDADCRDANQQRLPESLVGTPGDVVSVRSIFDGWGYVHLFGFSFGQGANSATFTELDTFAIPEAMDPAFAEGHGVLSVHEVAVDPQDPSLAYLSYYAGGLRAIQIQCSNPADTSTCELVEVGGYLDPLGNEFWGVETQVRNGVTYIFASDMDSGLWIFRDP